MLFSDKKFTQMWLFLNQFTWKALGYFGLLYFIGRGSLLILAVDEKFPFMPSTPPRRRLSLGSASADVSMRSRHQHINWDTLRHCTCLWPSSRTPWWWEWNFLQLIKLRVSVTVWINHVTIKISGWILLQWNWDEIGSTFLPLYFWQRSIFEVVTTAFYRGESHCWRNWWETKGAKWVKSDILLKTNALVVLCSYKPLQYLSGSAHMTLTIQP